MKIVAPENCPSCGSTLERVNAQLFCRNIDKCSAQSAKKLQTFCKKMKLKGFGEVALNKLNLQDINELYNLTPEVLTNAGFSQHMANKLTDVVKDKLEYGYTLSEFLASCSIPMVGDGVSRKLNVDNPEDITYQYCKDCGIGDKASSNLVTWIEEEWPKYIDTWGRNIKKNTITRPVDSNGFTVCITGKLNDFRNRKEATEYLSSRGFNVKSSVTKSLDYLICEDGTQRSSYKKAIQYEVKITTIKDLLEETN